ncbi:hypothetical protein GLOIN_2v1878583 [Rhizophagus irregularis DAOM 181602=DAOM 197198]|uniref:F-box domain-containing protein n=1 Tax=Rhizophagus irregularis (strain DAOM 181602 / DAOM 197198 / MUCL 43194) TaxID=747089 RepID=A0A2P4PRQ5_RHIID|nr:hypothetical protein GLOIN_2v1878583 [Rhizophagus irregularis DAOM 181602=DAOM 197198]POG68056.1 hypothetical protein GLOIN_2v1878583 [Rhizophagus irregularis DAOM 181602=DAOM 197198]|eukprot:XP_025174922.1 hypothetical protein GLOIN_2v1878583 [Rhizophagus irregularis DAOM 181602=DAOM 197198]
MITMITIAKVIDIIISHIDKSDSSTLLNVSLINREWCLIGILHLWKNQFININSKARFKVYSKILLSHLDNKTQSFLKVKDSFEQNEFSSHSINQEIDYNNENSGLLSYDYSKHSDGFQFKIENLIFLEVLFKLIMTKTKGIDFLRIISFEHGNFLKRDLISLITGISHEISTFSLSLSDDFDQYLETIHVSKFLKDKKKLKKLNVKPNNLVTSKYIRKSEFKKVVFPNLLDLEIINYETELEIFSKVLKRCRSLKVVDFGNRCK